MRVLQPRLECLRAVVELLSRTPTWRRRVMLGGACCASFDWLQSCRAWVVFGAPLDARTPISTRPRYDGNHGMGATSSVEQRTRDTTRQPRSHSAFDCAVTNDLSVTAHTAVSNTLK